MYHSSPSRIENRIDPRPSAVIDGETAVFAANLRYVSMLFLAKWTDYDLTFGKFAGRWAVIEMRPGAFRDVFAGRTGYIYRLPEAGFRDDPRLGLHGVEFINRESVPILETEYIADVWAALQKTPIVFIDFDRYHAAVTDLVAREERLEGTSGAQSRAPRAAKANARRPTHTQARSRRSKTAGATTRRTSRRSRGKKSSRRASSRVR